MIVTFARGRFVAKCTFEERHLLKASKFYWDKTQKHWYTIYLERAAALRDYFDESAEKVYRARTVYESPWPGGLAHSKREKLRPFQEDAVRFALSRNHSYLGLEQGLGKTPIAATVAFTRGLNALIVCPPFLAYNWVRELTKWRPNKLHTIARVVNGKGKIEGDLVTDLPCYLVLPDSLLDKRGVLELLRRWRGEVGFQLIVDEAHRFKSETAKRTRMLLGRSDCLEGGGLARDAKYTVLLSGTPMPARPIELYPALNRFASNTIDHFGPIEYGQNYCAGFRDQFGWDFTGASNLPELRKRIKPYLLRLWKDDVLDELPPKEERIVFVAEKAPRLVTALERTLLEDNTIRELIDVDDFDIGDVAEYRRLLGEAKAESAAAYVREILDESDEPLLVFAWHKTVIEKLRHELCDFDPEVITGKTDKLERVHIVDRFQGGASRVLIAQIQTMVGLTLTKAKRVVFAEYSWTPSDNDQAADRAHRIGQKDAVLIDYLVFAKSLDEYVLESVLQKKDTIHQLLK